MQMVPSVLRQCCIECGHTELLHEIPDRAYSGYQRGDYFTLTLFPLTPQRPSEWLWACYLFVCSCWTWDDLRLHIWKSNRLFSNTEGAGSAIVRFPSWKSNPCSRFFFRVHFVHVKSVTQCKKGSGMPNCGAALLAQGRKYLPNEWSLANGLFW